MKLFNISQSPLSAILFIICLFSSVNVFGTTGTPGWIIPIHIIKPFVYPDEAPQFEYGLTHLLSTTSKQRVSITDSFGKETVLRVTRGSGVFTDDAPLPLCSLTSVVTAYNALHYYASDDGDLDMSASDSDQPSLFGHSEVDLRIDISTTKKENAPLKAISSRLKTGTEHPFRFSSTDEICGIRISQTDVVHVLKHMNDLLREMLNKEKYTIMDGFKFEDKKTITEAKNILQTQGKRITSDFVKHVISSAKDKNRAVEMLTTLFIVYRLAEMHTLTFLAASDRPDGFDHLASHHLLVSLHEQLPAATACGAGAASVSGASSTSGDSE